MKSEASRYDEILGNEGDFIRGQTDFRNIQISWMFSEEFGLTITRMRCGICNMPLESVALHLGKEVYLVCGDGHLVGSELKPNQTEVAWDEVRELQVEEKRRRFTKHYEYNKKLEEVIKRFKETYFEEIQRRRPALLP